MTSYCLVMENLSMTFRNTNMPPCVLRSPYARAKIKSIDTKEAKIIGILGILQEKI